MNPDPGKYQIQQQVRAAFLLIAKAEPELRW